jgi:hypothetical protein
MESTFSLEGRIDDESKKRNEKVTFLDVSPKLCAPHCVVPFV